MRQLTNVAMTGRRAPRRETLSASGLGADQGGRRSTARAVSGHHPQDAAIVALVARSQEQYAGRNDALAQRSRRACTRGSQQRGEPWPLAQHRRRYRLVPSGDTTAAARRKRALSSGRPVLMNMPVPSSKPAVRVTRGTMARYQWKRPLSSRAGAERIT